MRWKDFCWVSAVGLQQEQCDFVNLWVQIKHFLGNLSCSGWPRIYTKLSMNSFFMFVCLCVFVKLNFLKQFFDPCHSHFPKCKTEVSQKIDKVLIFIFLLACLVLDVCSYSVRTLKWTGLKSLPIEAHADWLAWHFSLFPKIHSNIHR